ncbi:putative transposase [Pedobacter africanus]|uniref:Transposase InsO family protein n=1 Tax=Pedobacter africanus TaxID=151894 RepID=A0ACC6KQV5_9SPHI|nr:IS3 family transposase [Pedobacter africanus]MDR6781529.1 transposase InsO family protein [Pedobacter africanus]
MTQLISEEQGISIKTLCSLFGKSRNAWYESRIRIEKDVLIRDIVLQEVYTIRTELPGVGTRKLHFMLKDILSQHGISAGRDYLFDLLAATGLLVTRRRRRVITTDSNHWMRRYDNLMAFEQITRPEQVWVSDITYLRLNNSFVYLSLITDAYSRQIMGYHLQNDLSAEGCLRALRMAIAKRKTPKLTLMHHSDRGSQYCSKAYVDELNGETIAISMTKNGDPYENAIAERVNGILKTEFDLERSTGTFEQLKIN